MNFGLGTIESQLLSVGPYGCSFVVSMIAAAISDRISHRFLFVLGSVCMAIAGQIILRMVHHNTPLQYAALCLVASGTYTSMPVVLCWVSMNGTCICFSLVSHFLTIFHQSGDILSEASHWDGCLGLALVSRPLSPPYNPDELTGALQWAVSYLLIRSLQRTLLNSRRVSRYALPSSACRAQLLFCTMSAS